MNEHMNQVVERVHSQDAVKVLIELGEGQCIEVGVIRHFGQTHLCMPSQIGCPMGCRHCATTYAAVPYAGNLDEKTLKSVVSQFVEKYRNDKPVLSFSGHGEPMLNWAAVRNTALAFRERLEAVFMTSVGVRSCMDELLKEPDPFIVLYFSVHGATDVQRHVLIPDRKGIASLNDIVDFTNSYGRKGGRVVWNYMLHRDNVSMDSLKPLKDLFGAVETPIMVRITQMNSIGSEKTQAIQPATQTEFEHFSSEMIALSQSFPSVTAYISEFKGGSIGVACGQMRALHHYTSSDAL